MTIRFTKPNDWDFWQIWVIDWIFEKHYGRFVIFGVCLEW